MSTPPSKFFNRYEFDEDVRDERDRLRTVNEQLLLALQAVLKHVYCQNDYTSREYEQYYASLDQARAAIAEAQKATGTQP